MVGRRRGNLSSARALAEVCSGAGLGSAGPDSDWLGLGANPERGRLQGNVTRSCGGSTSLGAL